MREEAGHLLVSAASGNMVWMVTVSVLVLAGLATAYVVLKLFSRIKQEKNGPTGPVFSLEELKQMHKTGQISEEEYKILKSKAASAYSDRKDSF